MICPNCEKEMVDPYISKRPYGFTVGCRPCKKRHSKAVYDVKRKARDLRACNEILEGIRRGDDELPWMN